MATSSIYPEGRLFLPRTSLRRSNGIAIDIGGSLIKIAYIPEEQSTSEPEKVEVKFVTFAIDKLEEGLDYLLSHVGGEKWRENKLYCTGKGSHELQAIIETKLGKTLTVLVELHCFADATMFLRKHIKEDFLAPPSKQGVMEAGAYLTELADQLARFQMRAQNDKDTKMKLPEMKNTPSDKNENTTIPADTKPEQDTDEGPCLLALLGSASGYIKLEQDGSFSMMGVSCRTGKTFVGLGCLLTGAKNFGELIDLAEKGDFHNLHIVAKDFKNPESKDLYALFADEFLLYCFGKADGAKLEDFRKEDLAAALLMMLAMDTIEQIHLTCVANGIRQAYLTGNFTTHPRIQQELTKWAIVNTTNPRYPSVKIDFVHGGGHMGAIGALLHGIKTLDEHSK